MSAIKEHYHEQIEAGMRTINHPASGGTGTTPPDPEGKGKKERPILFSTPMVQAILEGRKTQTRRIFKSHPRLSSDIEWAGKYLNQKPEFAAGFSPYGQSGDLLWVRESFDPTGCLGSILFKANYSDAELSKAAKGTFKWKPSIHMPKDAARIWLQVEEIGVERVQDIAEEDAVSEGVELLGNHSIVVDKPYYKNYDNDDEEIGWLNPVNSFESLWYQINGSESWEANPWVWVVKFKVLSTTGKPV